MSISAILLWGFAALLLLGVAARMYLVWVSHKASRDLAYLAKMREFSIQQQEQEVERKMQAATRRTIEQMLDEARGQQDGRSR